MAANSTLAKVLSCLAGELARIEADLYAIANEAVPGLSESLLSKWEEDLGLPEECFPLAMGLKERQDAAHAKYTTKYTGLSETFFVDLALSLGATIEIIIAGGVGTPFRSGGTYDTEITRVGPYSSSSDPKSRVWSAARIHTWIVKIASSEPNIDIIQCLFERWKPAHTVVQFVIT